MPPKQDPKGKDAKTKDTKGSTSGKKSDSKASTRKDDSSGGGKQKAAQSINVRHILCEKHARKEEALARLNAGAKFDEVARDFSEDKARQGGALGWKTKGSLLPEFEAVAFALEVSTTGSPKWGECRTGEGYHLVMVEGRR